LALLRGSVPSAHAAKSAATKTVGMSGAFRVLLALLDMQASAETSMDDSSTEQRCGFDRGMSVSRAPSLFDGPGHRTTALKLRLDTPRARRATLSEEEDHELGALRLR
jgi:hypothetical protein